MPSFFRLFEPKILAALVVLVLIELYLMRYSSNFPLGLYIPIVAVSSMILLIILLVIAIMRFLNENSGKAKLITFKQILIILGILTLVILLKYIKEYYRI